MRTEKGIHELMLGIIAEGSDMSLTVGQKIGITTRLIEALREEGNLIIPHDVFSEAEVCDCEDPCTHVRAMKCTGCGKLMEDEEQT